MQTPEELSKEMAAFCRQEVKKPQHEVVKSWLDKAALQGITIALLAVSAAGGAGESPDRSGSGWTN